MDKDHLIADSFDVNTMLAKWLGMAFTVTGTEGEKGEAILMDSVVQEMKIGQGNFPPHYNKYFKTTTTTQQTHILSKRQL